MSDKLETIELNEKQAKARKLRSRAIAVLLVAFVVFVYAITYFKIGPDIANRGF